MPNRTKIKTLLYTVCAVLVFSGCESLEVVVDKSRTRVSAYGNDIYWKGEKVGYFRDADSKEKEYKEKLIDAGLWIERSGQTRTYGFRYISTNIPDLAEIYNTSGTLISAYIVMEVPAGIGKTGYDFYHIIYYPQSKTGTVLGTSKTNRTVTPSDLGVVTPYATTLFPDARGDFYRQKQQTLQNETVAPTNEHYFAFFESSFRYHVWSMSQTKIKNAQTRIESEVKPIMLAHARGGVAFSNSFLNFDYETNFGYDTGTVESGESAREDFNLDDDMSYLLKIAGGTNGVEVNYLIEHFIYGAYDYYTSSSEDNPKQDIKEHRRFETKRRQIEVLYHFAWRDIPRLGGMERKTRIHDYYVGYRYLTFRAPKISYTYIGYKEHHDYQEVRKESTPQFVETRAHIVGGGVNNHMIARSKGIHLLYSVEAFVGMGQCEMKKADYYSIYAQTDVEKNTYTRFTYPFYDLGGSLGLSANFDVGPVRTSMFANYGINIYMEQINGINDGDRFSPQVDAVSNEMNTFHVVKAGLNCYF